MLHDSAHVHDAASAHHLEPAVGPSGRGADARFAVAVTSLTEAMEEELLPMWVSMTGLQVLFLKKVARDGRVTRVDLMRGCRTSRNAAVPGLASLLQRGFLVETHPGAESVLSMGPAGVEVLAEIATVRAAWVRSAVAGVHEDTGDADLDRAADLLERMLATTVAA
jgi:hypothetical protein